jgi:ADP-ribose pyrophosphatase
VIYLYAAKNLKKTQQNLDEGEFLSVEKIKISDAADMVMKGEISDSKTVALVLKVAKLKEEGKL